MDTQFKTQIDELQRMAKGLLNRAEDQPNDLGDWVYDLSYEHPFLEELYDELFDAYEHWPATRRTIREMLHRKPLQYDPHSPFQKLVFTLTHLLAENISLTEIERVFNSVTFLGVNEDMILENIQTLIQDQS